MTYRMKEVRELLDTLLETQPKTSSGGGGKTREEVVIEKAKELLEKLPAGYVPDVYTSQIQKLGGLDVPLNVFLFQEVQRLQIVIQIVRETLTILMQAIRGEVVMTSRLMESMNAKLLKDDSIRTIEQGLNQFIAVLWVQLADLTFVFNMDNQLQQHTANLMLL